MIKIYKSSSRSYFESIERIKRKIAEFNSGIYNYENICVPEIQYDIKNITNIIKDLNEKKIKFSTIDSLRPIKNNIESNIRKLKDKRIKLQEELNKIPCKIKELKKCVKYYRNLLNKKV